MPFNPFSAITSKIFAGASAVLLIAVVACWMGWSHAAHQRDDQIKANGALELKLSTSNASIDTLQAKIAEMNALTDKQAADFASAQKQAAADRQKLAEQVKGSDALIARLRARGAQSGGACVPVVPDDLKKEAKGL